LRPITAGKGVSLMRRQRPNVNPRPLCEASDATLIPPTRRTPALADRQNSVLVCATQWRE